MLLKSPQKRPTDLKGHDGCKVSPPVWSILFGQNADLTNGHDCIIIKPVKQAWFAWGGHTEEILIFDGNGLLVGWANLGETFRD